jgi:NodT family efflux transporter outer membrane factor (OMF) lipoprotein
MSVASRQSAHAAHLRGSCGVSMFCTDERSPLRPPRIDGPICLMLSTTGNERCFVPNASIPRGRPWGAAVILTLLAVALTPGCMMVGPDYKEPELPVAEKWLGWREKISRDPADRREWWRTFRDPALNRLIEIACEQNLTLLSAGTRVLQARAELGIAVGELYPQKQQGTGDLRLTRLSQAIPLGAGGASDRLRTFWLDALNFQAAWEVDLWGRIRRGVESADAQYLASIASYDETLVTLLGDVATTYIGIRVLERQIAIARENVARQRTVVRIAHDRFEGGVSTLLDVHQAENILANTEASIPRLQIQLNQGLNALRVLLGMPPQSLDFLLSRSTARIPSSHDRASLGIPADLLRRRPDIRVAELRAVAQSARIGIAKAELLPAISITGTIGGLASNVGARNLGDVVLPVGRHYMLGPSFKWNVLNYGQITNDVRLQDATLQQYLVDYQNSVLKAQQEVENGIYTFRLSRTEAAHLQRSVDEARKAVEIALLEYQQGTRDFTTMLNAQQYLYDSQNSHAIAAGNVSTGLVMIYRSLGGGWEIRDDKPFVSPSVARQMRERTDWGGILPPDGEAPAQAPGGLPTPSDIGSLIRLPEW